MIRSKRNRPIRGRGWMVRCAQFAAVQHVRAVAEFHAECAGDAGASGGDRGTTTQTESPTSGISCPLAGNRTR